jgi:hypothetical protein
MRQPELPVKTRKVWVLGLVSILVITTIKSANVAAVENAVAKPKYPQCTLENVEKLRERHECLTSVGMKGCFQALGGAEAIMAGTLIAAGALIPPNKKSQQSLEAVVVEYKNLKKAFESAKKRVESLKKEVKKLEGAPPQLQGKSREQRDREVKASRDLGLATANRLAALSKLGEFEGQSYHNQTDLKAMIRAYAGANERLKNLSNNSEETGEIVIEKAKSQRLKEKLDETYADYLRVNLIKQGRKRLFMAGGLAGLIGAGFTAYQSIGPDPDPIPPNCRNGNAEDIKGIQTWVRLDSKCKREITQAGLIDLNLKTQEELTDLCVQNPDLAATLHQFQEQTDRVLKDILPSISALDCKTKPVTFATMLDGKPYTYKLAADKGLWTLGGTFSPGGSTSNTLESYLIKFDQKHQGGVFVSANPQFYNSNMTTVAHFLSKYVEQGYLKTSIGEDSSINAPMNQQQMSDSVARQFLSLKIALPFVQKVCSEVQRVDGSSSSSGGTATGNAVK